MFLHLVQPERRWACAPLSLQGLDNRKAPVLKGKPSTSIRSSKRQYSRFSGESHELRKTEEEYVFERT